MEHARHESIRRTHEKNIILYVRYMRSVPIFYLDKLGPSKYVNKYFDILLQFLGY